MTFLVVFIGILPAIAWLIFYLEEDTDHEPAKEVFAAFLAGSGITLIVLGFQYLFNDAAQIIAIEPFSPLSLIGLAAIEEFFKFSATFLLISRSRYFDQPIDAMIYMIIVALGFATVENIGALQNQFRDSAVLSSVVGTVTLRFVGATLLHTLASGLVGYYWAKGIIAKELPKYLALGLVLATFVHALFNLLVLQFDEQATYPILFLVVISFFILNDFEKLKHPTTRDLEMLREEVGR
jgi:RsiW-degrading membrane proteinase PrsW (M82 family)